MAFTMPRRSFALRRFGIEFLEVRNLLTTLVDMDADGDLDAVRATAWYENLDGEGDFFEHAFSDNSGMRIGFHVGDLDGDGDADVLTSQGRWFENTDGLGTLSVSHPWNESADDFDSVRLHDSDLDGDLDLVASLRNEQAVLYLNDGSGEFTARSSIRGPFAAAADFNGDGLLDDVVPAASGSGELWIRLNQGNGVFETSFVVPGSPNVGTFVAAIRDIDGNGFEDVVTYEDWTLVTSTWTANDAGRFHRGGHLGSADGLVLLVDLDADGDLDSILHNLGTMLTWEYTEGRGGLRGTAFFEAPVLSCTPSFSDAGDINGDGLLDFACSGNKPQLWLDGSVVAVRGQRVEPTPVGDVNGDGVFNSSDLLVVMRAGEYEDDLPNNSSWEDGDWNRDGDFTTSDLVLAFQSSVYVEMSANDRSIPASLATGTNSGSSPMLVYDSNRRTKRPLQTQASVIPISVAVGGANVHDTKFQFRAGIPGGEDCGAGHPSARRALQRKLPLGIGCE